MRAIISHTTSGRLRAGGGAAAAALRLRAAEWEIALVEAPGRIELSVWGGSVALCPEAGGAEIEIRAPEERILRLLQDSVTELLAAHDLAIEWRDVAEGALAPGLSLMRVVAVGAPTPGFVRVRLAGPEAARFGTGALHFRLLIPPRGRTGGPGADGAPVWPRIAASGRTVWPEGPDALHRPVFTTVAQGDDWLEFDIFRHTGSPACDWAGRLPLGETVGVMGPGGGGIAEGAPLLLYGDQTALPAIRRMLAARGAEARAVLRCAPADLGGLAGDPRVTLTRDLVAALPAQAPAPGAFLWFAASEPEARAARAHLAALGIPRKAFMAAAYWS
ncbi:siderophore-interacting protein [Frigidibacter sp. MR17.24]|uniref:siderophore-interacting protein n=1 Tax=Frigidibacter sp. MR17.24 TaxID=3127345 RepID=UPI003012B265